MLSSILIIVLSVLCPTWAITCLDDDNKPVEWYVVYKFPESFDYAFITPKTSTWRKSSHKIDADGMIKNTFDGLYNLLGKPDSVYAMFNDEKSQPETRDVWFGHMKGAFAFQAGSGFWLIHSVPKLSDASGAYAYPATGKVFGQHLFCVSLSADYLSPLIDQLIVSRPWIQDSYVSKEIEEANPNITLLIHHKITSQVTHSIRQFNSINGLLKMTHFSKSVHFGADLYGDLVAPELKVGLNVETWQHGSKEENEPSTCDRPDSTVFNVKRVSFSHIGVDFSNFNDHSKWAVSFPATSDSDATRHWICLGDINRQVSQFHRGGGTMCVQHSAIWKAFDSIVFEVEPCWPDGSVPRNSKA